MKRLGTSYGLSKGPLVAQLRSPILEVHALDLESFTKKAKVFLQKQQSIGPRLQGTGFPHDRV